MSPEDLLAKVDGLLRAGRSRAADRLIRMYPDVAEFALQQSVPGVSAALPRVAQVHERQCGIGPGGWPDLLRDRQEHPERYAEFDREREARSRLLREGRFTEAADIDLRLVPKDSPASPLLRIEVRRQRGLALLLGGQPEAAAESFRAAADSAKVSRPFSASHLLLLLSEACSRAKEPSTAAVAWRESVDEAMALAEEPREIVDPGFWERAIHLKPAGESWPPALGALLRRLQELRLGVLVPEGTDFEVGLWGMIAASRLGRGESRGALVAYSRASSCCTHEGLKDALRLGQARALIRQGQWVAAKALLSVPAAGPDGSASAAALSLLGSLELRFGEPARALVMLRKVVEDAGVSWAGRGEAEANLGLAYLTAGQEVEGLRWLRAAETRFEAERDPAGLGQALRNELLYQEERGREREVAGLRERLRTLEE